MRNLLKWGGIGCGGLVTLIIVIAVISAVVGGGAQGGQQADSQGGDGGNGSGSGGGEQQPTATVGESLTVGKTSWTATEANKQQQLSSSFG